MKLDKLFQNLLLTGAVVLFISTPAKGKKVQEDIQGESFISNEKVAVKAKSPVDLVRSSKTRLKDSQIANSPQTAKSGSDDSQKLVQTPTPTDPPNPEQGSGEQIISITGVQTNSTDKGVELVLQTTQGEQLQVTNRSAGNSFIADVSGAQLQLPSGEAFTYRSSEFLAGITEITVSNIDANTVRVTVVGEKALPTVELFDDNAGLVFGVTPAATAQAQENPVTQTPQTPATSSSNPLNQEQTNGDQVVPITGVKANPTEKGVEIILQTNQEEQLQITNRSADNNFIADIPGAQLQLPSGEAFVFRSEKPIAGITEITATNLDANTVRLTVIGETGLPTVELFDSPDEGLIFSVASTASATQPSEQPETPQQEPSAQQDEPIELIVTGEQDTYRVEETTTGTRTDTPLRDIPQSIQVVPQQVLRDQQVTRLDDALRNVPGVAQDFNSGPSATYRIRGFEALNNNLLRNGQVDAGAGESVELSSVERVEVLKGPASVLFGLGNPGGSINIITKRPLSEVFEAVDLTIGNYNYYRGAIDLSGPLNDSGTVLYRFNTAYKNSGSFIDFYNSESFNISPVVSVAIGERTNLTLEGDYITNRELGFTPFVPVVGSVSSNPIGKIPRNRNVGEPTDEIEQTITRLGYQLEHKFNDNWSLRNAFLFNFRDYSDQRTLPGILQADNRTLNRSYREFDFQSISYNLSTNVVGKFSTGSIQHQLLFGIDLNSFENRVPSFRSTTAAPLDIFNPVYGQAPGELSPESSNTTVTNSLGIYIQDQISLTDGLKVLLGGRFDAFDQKSEDFSFDTESSKSDSAFSPRLGIVYQPIPAISLYGSYVSSFTPGSGLFLFGGSLDAATEPERGRQYEVGVKADFNDRLSATLAFYDLTRTNVLTDDPDNPGFQIQTGEQNSQGIELSLAGEILPGWNFIAGYAYTDARITEDNTFEVGNRLPNTPYHSFNLWTTYQIQTGNLQGLGFGLGLFFVGDRAGDLGNSYEIPSYLRTDAAIFYNQDRLRLALNFKNLFDIEYFENGSSATRVNYGQPFTVQGTVSWQF